MSSFVRVAVPCRMEFRDGVAVLLEALCEGLVRLRAALNGGEA